jgi:hypothetical protein
MYMGMRLTMLCSLCLVAGIGFGQDWVPQGGITSRQYEKQIREGGQVTATDFFTLEYSVATWIEELGDGGGPSMVCTNKCKGNVHKGHPTCDYSCDDRCTETHRLRVKGEYFPDRSAMNAATAAANGLAARGGGTASPSDWSHRVSSALAEFRREANKRKTFDMAHAGPCSGKSQKVDVRTYAFHVRGTMKKVGYRMSRGVRTPINETVGMHESVVATAKIVKDEPKDKKDWGACLCKAPQEPEVDIDAMLDRLIELLDGLIEQERLSHLCGTAAVSMRDKAGQHVDPGESKIVVKPVDMNRCEVQIENGTGTDVEVTIPIGTVFQAQDKSFQDMASVVTTRGMLYAGQTKSFYVSLRPDLVQTTALFPVRWACLNIAKKEPSPSTRYTMRSPQDDVLIRLGAITDQARVRGPHDQARVWIYTDKAPIDEVNKRMLPGVSEGRYTTLLHDVAKAGVDLSGTEFRRCIEPKLLTGVALDDQAAAALVSVLAEAKPADLARFIDANAATIARLVDSDPQYGPGHVATVATALLSEDNADVRKSGLKLVTSVRPENRAAFAGAGGLAGVRQMLTNGIVAEASSALDALIAYSLEHSGELLGASWEQLPTDALKVKAKKHLGIE